MFIRRKQIKKKPYAYLVENTWKNGTSKQTVKEYLGRIYDVQERPPPDLQEVPDNKLFKELLVYEVSGQEVDISLDERTVKRGSRDVVLALNGGYLCAYTLQEIFRAFHARNEERPGVKLATALSNAGLRINKEAFIRLYLYHQP